MKCQILFSGKNKDISICHLLKILSRVVSVKVAEVSEYLEQLKLQ